MSQRQGSFDIVRAIGLSLPGVRVGFEEREALIADDPRVYYVKPHYQDYPTVLVRLAVIDREALRDLLKSAWRTVTAATTRRRPRSSLGRTR
jgi:hypothetical protein